MLNCPVLPGIILLYWRGFWQVTGLSRDKCNMAFKGGGGKNFVADNFFTFFTGFLFCPPSFSILQHKNKWQELFNHYLHLVPIISLENSGHDILPVIGFFRRGPPWLHQRGTFKGLSYQPQGGHYIL